MKTILVIAIFTICLQGLFAQDPTNTIYPIVNGNQVSIHQDNSYHNCGFSPGLEHVIINDSIINWYQVDTLGIYYGCMCFFDYAVNIDSLNPGNYTVFVHSVYPVYNISDTTYEGSTTFTIEGQVRCDSILQLTSYASACHVNTGLENDHPDDEQFVIVSNANVLSIGNKGSRRITKVLLSNLSGQVVLKKDYISSLEIQLSTSFLKKGIYVISIYDEHNNVENRKVVIF